jgi:aminoglycoside phosphotransferase family enzyme
MNNRLIQVILKKGNFPHVFNDRKLIETHISYVILGTSFAYKFKKEIKYSFLDFSTLQKRKYYCERELMLNNRLTQGMYLEVVPIRIEGNEISINSLAGKIIDYAIKMKRMQDAKQMHVMLQKKQVTAQHIKSLAILIRKFHDRTDVIDRKYNPDHFISRFNDILSISAFAGQSLGIQYEKLIEKAVRMSDHFLERHSDLFIQRIKNGYIRDGHGDLHSRNIFLYAKPVIFDCIEFNDEFRQIDILDEIAFFCMDLDAEGFDAFSKTFTDKYFAKTKMDFGPREQLLFIYYKSYRANVRAKVNALRAKTSEGDVLKKNLAEVQKYLALMNSYLKELI